MCAGVRIPAALSERGGDVVGEDAERDGNVYGQQCILCAIRYRHSLGICGVSVPRVHLPPLRLPGRLLHNQRLTFSSVTYLSPRNDVVGRAHLPHTHTQTHTHPAPHAHRNICVGSAPCVYCTPSYAVIWTETI